MYEIRIGCLLRQVNAALVRYRKERMEELEMTPAQSMMLEHLLTRDAQKCYLTDICKETGISKSSVSMMLKALRKKGYIEVVSDFSDDRKKRIVVTQKAYEMQEKIEDSLKRRSDCVYRNISAKELEQLENTLNKMVSNLKQDFKEEEIPQGYTIMSQNQDFKEEKLW